MRSRKTVCLAGHGLDPAELSRFSLASLVALNPLGAKGGSLQESWFSCLVVVNLSQTKKRKTSFEELPPSDWSMGVTAGILLINGGDCR